MDSLIITLKFQFPSWRPQSTTKFVLATEHNIIRSHPTNSAQRHLSQQPARVGNWGFAGVAAEAQEDLLF